MTILGALDLVDQQMDKISGQITRCSADDPELGAGMATTALPSLQTTIDRAAVAVDEVDAHLRTLARRGSL